MSVSQYGPSCEPAGLSDFGPLVIDRGEPTHDRCPGGESTPGLIGGWACPCTCHQRPAPHALWQQAEREHPDDIDAHRARYRELMVEHGHLIPGKPKPLPCGWSPSPPNAPSEPASRETARAVIAGYTPEELAEAGIV